MPKFEDFTYESSTGKNLLHARRCLPDGKPRAVVQIEHDLADHISRYDGLMEMLAENGIFSVGCDRLGHGDSVRRDEDLGFFSEEDGWAHVVKDLDLLRDLTRRAYPDLPYLFFGQGMGSFVVRSYLIRHPGRYDAAVLSGTGHPGKLLLLAGSGALGLMGRSRDPYAGGKAFRELAFGSYCKQIPDPRTPFDWLSRDEEAVDRYLADPRCGFPCQAGLYRDLLDGLRLITDQRNIDRMNKEAPILFLSGDADPVGEYSQGVERAYQAFRSAGLKDVSIRLYPGGRHEMLSETNKEDVKQDILNWINEKLKKIG